MKRENLNQTEEKINVTNIVTEQKARIERTHEELLKEAQKLGEQDGTLNLPQAQDELASPNEGVIRSQYQKLIADVWNKGRPYMDAPHLDYKTSSEKIEAFDENQETEFQRELEIIEQKKADTLTHLGHEFEVKEGELNDYDKMVQRDYLAAKNTLEKVQNRTGRQSPLIHFKSKIWYFILLIGIGLSEVPLNIQIFQKFGEAFFITIIMSLSLAISIPVLAHFTGVFVRQRKEKKEYLGFALMCIALFLIFNFGVSIFRAYALAENIGSDVDNLNIIIFTSLNLILFTIGVLASYFRHDDSYELEYAYAKFQKEKTSYDSEKAIIHDKMKAIKEERNNRTKGINAQYVEEKARLNHKRDELMEFKHEAMKVYDELLNAFTALEEEVEASYYISVEKYRAANLMHRKNHMSPRSWAKGIRPLKLKYHQVAELDPN